MTGGASKWLESFQDDDQQLVEIIQVVVKKDGCQWLKVYFLVLHVIILGICSLLKCSSVFLNFTPSV